MSLYEMRKVLLKLLVLVVLVMAQYMVRSAPIQAQTATPVPDEDEAVFGRLTSDADLVTGPNGTVITEIAQGSEFLVVDGNSAGTWLKVEMLADGENGWVGTEFVEIAEAGSTATYRVYGDGQCVATPTVARARPGASRTESYRFQLLFARDVDVEDLGEFYLVFNHDIRDLQVEFNPDDNAIALPNWWVYFHDTLDPQWDTEQAWRLEWECDTGIPNESEAADG